MYRRPKFLEVLIGIREQMAFEADYDVELLAQKARIAAESESSLPDIPFETNDLPPDNDLSYSEYLENLQ